MYTHEPTEGVRETDRPRKRILHWGVPRQQRRRRRPLIEVITQNRGHCVCVCVRAVILLKPQKMDYRDSSAAAAASPAATTIIILKKKKNVLEKKSYRVTSTLNSNVNSAFFFFYSSSPPPTTISIAVHRGNLFEIFFLHSPYTLNRTSHTHTCPPTMKTIYGISLYYHNVDVE